MVLIRFVRSSSQDWSQFENAFSIPSRRLLHSQGAWWIGTTLDVAYSHSYVRPSMEQANRRVGFCLQSCLAVADSLSILVESLTSDLE